MVLLASTEITFFLIEMARNLLLISSSRVYGFGYLENTADVLRNFLKKFAVQTVLFIPYANTKYDEYLETVRKAFSELNLGANVRGIHEGDNPVEEVNQAQAVFIGGGNTFLLLKTLYANNLIDILRTRVLKDGVPYIGSSAGTNVATVSINTTNDMPIVYPPSFQALGFVPFNINPHFLDTDPHSKHKGETRTERIQQYLEMSTSYPVLGLREGSSLLVTRDQAVLIGDQPAILFAKNHAEKEYPANSNLSFLLQ